MSDYTKTTDFAAKDALPSGNPGKVARGAEVDAEFEAIEVAVTSKLNSSSYTAADVLGKLLTVDGVSSGLDADRLDGASSDFYQNASNLNAGTIPDARIQASGVTQHQAVLAVTASLISGSAHSCIAYNSGGQVISNLTLTALTWDSEIHDDTTFHSTSVNTSRMTIPAGVLRVRINAKAVVLTSVNANATFNLHLYKNGSITSPIVFSDAVYTTSGNVASPIMSISTPPLAVTEGEYFEIMIFQNAGSVTMNSTGYFSIEKAV